MPFFQRNHREKPYLCDDDVRLMLDFQAGNTESFERLLEKYFPPVMNFVYRYTGNRTVAEDLTQEVFIKVYRSAASYTPKARFKTWIYTIARNCAFNEAKRSSRGNVSLDAIIDTGSERLQRQVEDKEAPQPGEELIRSETIQRVREAVASLPDKQRTAIILRRYDEFSYEEIAETMHISEKAVKSLLNRARENLRNALSGIIQREE